MAEKCSKMQQILEWEDREFEEAMREQVSTIFHSANILNNFGFFNVFLKTSIITQ